MSKYNAYNLFYLFLLMVLLGFCGLIQVFIYDFFFVYIKAFVFIDSKLSTLIGCINAKSMKLKVIESINTQDKKNLLQFEIRLKKILIYLNMIYLLFRHICQ